MSEIEIDEIKNEVFEKLSKEKNVKIAKKYQIIPICSFTIMRKDYCILYGKMKILKIMKIFNIKL